MKIIEKKCLHAFWQGCKKCLACVGVLSEKWIDKVIEMKGVGDRTLMQKMKAGNNLLHIASLYVSHQPGRTELAAHFQANN